LKLGRLTASRQERRRDQAAYDQPEPGLHAQVSRSHRRQPSREDSKSTFPPMLCGARRNAMSLEHASERPPGRTWNIRIEIVTPCDSSSRLKLACGST
jgi:hypothetical protein